MKSTKAMRVGSSVVLQVSTQQGEQVAEALTLIPDMAIWELYQDGKVVKRKLATVHTHNTTPKGSDGWKLVTTQT